jgi:nucleotide-binding universal stress UspA family protein
MFEKILAAVDGSEGARKAVELAAGLGERTNAELLVLHVREVEVGKFSGAMEPPQEARDLVNEVVAELADEGLVVKGQIRGAPFGRAAKEIVEEAEEAGCDAIVMGSRGLSDWAAILVGSVAHKVVSHAHCPVVIAR